MLIANLTDISLLFLAEKNNYGITGSNSAELENEYIELCK